MVGFEILAIELVVVERRIPTIEVTAAEQEDSATEEAVVKVAAVVCEVLLFDIGVAELVVELRSVGLPVEVVVPLQA